MCIVLCCVILEVADPCVFMTFVMHRNDKNVAYNLSLIFCNTVMLCPTRLCHNRPS